MPDLVDKWHAECLPCKWLTLHDEQEPALRASEEHVAEFHADIPTDERGRNYMGHVQFRTVGAVAHPKDAQRVDAVQPFRTFPGDGAANIPAVIEQQPEQVETAGSEE